MKTLLIIIIILAISIVGMIYTRDMDVLLALFGLSTILFILGLLKLIEIASDNVCDKL